MREGKDKWTGLVYWDIFFTVKYMSMTLETCGKCCRFPFAVFVTHSLSFWAHLTQKKKELGKATQLSFSSSGSS